jgi:DNA-binding phage protein
MEDLKARVAVLRRVDSSLRAISAISSFCVTEFGNCDWTSGPGIECILEDTASLLYCCFVAERNDTEFRHSSSGAIRGRYSTETASTRKAKRPAFISHGDATVDSFRREPYFAAEYLNDVLSGGDEQELMVPRRRVAEAFGGISKRAGNAKLKATRLYRTLSPKRNSELKSMNSMLKAMGLRLAVRPMGEWSL